MFIVVGGIEFNSAFLQMVTLDEALLHFSTYKADIVKKAWKECNKKTKKAKVA